MPTSSPNTNGTGSLLDALGALGQISQDGITVNAPDPYDYGSQVTQGALDTLTPYLPYIAAGVVIWAAVELLK